MTISAIQMRDRHTSMGMTFALIEKYVSEIEEALEFAYKSPYGTGNYICKRIYNIGLADGDYEVAVYEIRKMFERFGYGTKFDQGNLLTICW